MSISRTVCVECSERGIEWPTLGCAEWLVACDVATRSEPATQSHALVLVPRDVVDRAARTEGSGA